MSQQTQVVYVFGRTPPTDLLHSHLVGGGKCEALELRIYPDWIDTKKDIMDEALRVLDQSDVLKREHDHLVLVVSSLGILAAAMIVLMLARCKAKRITVLQVYRSSPLAQPHLAEFEIDLSCLFQQLSPLQRE